MEWDWKFLNRSKEYIIYEKFRWTKQVMDLWIRKVDQIKLNFRQWQDHKKWLKINDVRNEYKREGITSKRHSELFFWDFSQREGILALNINEVVPNTIEKKISRKIVFFFRYLWAVIKHELMSDLNKIKLNLKHCLLKSTFEVPKKARVLNQFRPIFC